MTELDTLMFISIAFFILRITEEVYFLRFKLKKAQADLINMSLFL